MTATLSPEWVYFQVAPSAMTWVTRFVEGCEYFGVVTAVWGKKGIGCVRTTADTREITTAFLQDLPLFVTIVSYAEIVKMTEAE